VPIYKCKGKDCGFATDDIGDFIEHKIKESLPRAESESPAEPEPKKHMTAKDYLDCPECFPKFEAEFLRRGYAKHAEKKAEAKSEALRI